MSQLHIPTPQLKREQSLGRGFGTSANCAGDKFTATFKWSGHAAAI